MEKLEVQHIDLEIEKNTTIGMERTLAQRINLEVEKNTTIRMERTLAQRINLEIEKNTTIGMERTLAQRINLEIGKNIMTIKESRYNAKLVSGNDSSVDQVDTFDYSRTINSIRRMGK